MGSMTTTTRPASVMLLPAGTDRTDRPRWLAERRKHIGASDMPILAGYPWRNVDQRTLWYEKTGQELPDRPSTKMRWGKRIEWAIIEDWASDVMHGEVNVGEGGELWQSTSWPRASATPDARTRCELGPCCAEAKSTDDPLEYGTEYAPTVPARVEIQDLWQMFVLGPHVRHVHNPVLFPDKSVVDRTVPRDDRKIAELLWAGAWWWGTYVTPRVPPPATAAAMDAINWVGRRPAGNVHILTEEQSKLMRRVHRLSIARGKVNAAYEDSKAELLGDLPPDAAVIYWPDGIKVAATWNHSKKVSGDDKHWVDTHPEESGKYGRLITITKIDTVAMAADYGDQLADRTGLTYVRTFLPKTPKNKRKKR